MDLTNKQIRFCEEYVLDLNATQACIRAGYSEKTANRIGSENLSKLDIQYYISELKEQISKKAEITHQETLERLKTWFESDITVLIGLSPEEVKALPLEVRQLIASYKHVSKTYSEEGRPVTEETIDVKFVSKERAADLISKHIGFYEKNNQQKNPNPEPELNLEHLTVDELLMLIKLQSKAMGVKDEFSTE
ncbi:terminase small subunit [Zunongwangia sp. F260]|uniref:Terminase small subunit n=1 Tax=Autumnicola lenta TaxID=3075593 RepID=A0ABU3CJ52_9FLAO|nr:terminase small subunit [Zunongwangia sp. F260]MDT0646321.1 terminase small subunit [Zunongwangia sp. F260]